MLSDDELPPLPAKSLLRRVMPDDFRYGDVLGYTADQMREYARAVERAAYVKAEQVCIETAAELRRCADGCTDGRYDWKADGAADCADAIRALGRQHD